MVIYVVSLLYTQCLRYNICSAWFLDIRISTCHQRNRFAYLISVLNFKEVSSVNTSLSVKYNKTFKALSVTLYDSLQLLVKIL